ncbi:MAG: anti-sigma factor [Alphaproteobacteria bacterium]|nr:anti-sigma factor [Alphaproteobacteria bacterium]MDX5369679.1 anti-sigma factor [Alphaproteobacteria bacterium]MDX5464314.1 anti-sigma factor [Alphaproteobacteria bacterium]
MTYRPLSSPLTDEDLHLYVDGQLAPERQAEVEAVLATMPELRRRVDGYREQNIALHQLYDAPLPAMPAEMRAQVDRLRHAVDRRRRVRHGFGVAAGIALCIVAGAAAHRAIESVETRADQIAAFTSRAATAHSLYADDRAAVARMQVGEDKGAALAAALSNLTGATPMQAPDLEPLGFRLIGGQLVPAQGKAALHYLYENGAGARVSLYVGRTTEDGSVDFTFASRDGMSAFFWRHGATAFTLIGPMTQEALLDMARAVGPQLVPRQPAGQPKVDEVATGAPATAQPAAPAPAAAPSEPRTPAPAAAADKAADMPAPAEPAAKGEIPPPPKGVPVDAGETKQTNT